MVGRSVILASFDRGLPIHRSPSSPPELFPICPCQAQTKPCAWPSPRSGGASTEELRPRSQRRPMRAPGVPRRPHPSAPSRAAPRTGPARTRGVTVALRAQRARSSHRLSRLCAGLYACCTRVVGGFAGAADARRGSPGPSQPPHRATQEVKLTGLKANPTEKRSYLRCIFGLAICAGLGGPAARTPCVRLTGSFRSRSPASPAHFSHQIGH